MNEKQKMKFDILFKKNYTTWKGSVDSLIKWCTKKVGDSE